MNEYAQRLGMKSSHFSDVDGLPDPQHYTTARDLATVANALVRDFPEYYYIFAMKDFTWNHIKQPNRNGLLWSDPSVDGLKTGHTDEAGYCLIASARRNGTRLVSVVLKAPKWHSREADSEALLNYGFNFFQTQKIATARTAMLKPRVYESASGYAAVGALADLYVTLPRGLSRQHLDERGVDQRPPGRTAGGRHCRRRADRDRRQRASGRARPLVTLEAVPTGGLLTRTMDGMRLWFH